MNFSTIIKTSLLVTKIVKINANNLIHQILLLQNHQSLLKSANTTNVPITIGKENTTFEVPPGNRKENIKSVKEKEKVTLV